MVPGTGAVVAGFGPPSCASFTCRISFVSVFAGVGNPGFERTLLGSCERRGCGGGVSGMSRDRSAATRPESLSGVL